MGLHEGRYHLMRMNPVKILIAVFIIQVAAACTASASLPKDSASIQTGSELKQVMLEVSTITCTGCWPRVEPSAKIVPGVIDVKFDKDRIQKVTVVCVTMQTSPAAIITAIEKRGDRAIQNSV